MLDLYYSNHAMKRVAERSELSKEEVITLIDKKSIMLGEENKKNRSHVLFYSKLDSRFYTAIYDNLIGEIITVLPEEYHENISWKISDEARFQAMQLVASNQYSLNDEVKTDNLKENISKTPSKYRLKLVTNFTGYPKFSRFLNFKINQYKDFNDFIKNKGVLRDIKSKIIEKYQKLYIPIEN